MSAGGDGVARTWDLTTGQCVNSFQATAASDDYLHCIVARPKQRQFLAGSDHGMLSLWGTHTRVYVWLHRKNRNVVGLVLVHVQTSILSSRV